MLGFVVAALVVGWFAALMFCAYMQVETDNPWWLAAGAGVVILGLGAFFNAILSVAERGPCLRYETSMHYNPATKTVMPARHCVDRAEWVQP